MKDIRNDQSSAVASWCYFNHCHIFSIWGRWKKMENLVFEQLDRGNSLNICIIILITNIMALFIGFSKWWLLSTIHHHNLVIINQSILVCKLQVPLQQGLQYSAIAELCIHMTTPIGAAWCKKRYVNCKYTTLLYYISPTTKEWLD